VVTCEPGAGGGEFCDGAGELPVVGARPLTLLLGDGVTTGSVLGVPACRTLFLTAVGAGGGGAAGAGAGVGCGAGGAGCEVLGAVATC